MAIRKALVSVGVGATTFLVVTVAVIELLGGDFPSVFIALPIGLVAGVAALLGVSVGLDADSSRLVQSTAAAIAAFAYVLLGLLFLRYSVASVRSLLTFGPLVGASLVAAATVGVLAAIRHPIIGA